MIRFTTGDWSSCELLTLVISLWNNHREAQCIENRKKKIDHRNVLSQKGGMSQYIHEAYGHKEKKDNPGLPAS